MKRPKISRRAETRPYGRVSAPTRNCRRFLTQLKPYAVYSHHYLMSLDGTGFFCIGSRALQVPASGVTATARSPPPSDAGRCDRAS